jgi:hypothetical protein
MHLLRGFRRAMVTVSSLTLVVVLSSISAAADAIPPEFRGAWATRCTDAAGPRLSIAAGRIEATINARSHRFDGIDVSRTWMGGARASGPGIWFLVSPKPGQPFAFVAAAAQGPKGPIVLEENDPTYARELRGFFGVAFRRCPAEAVPHRASSAPAADTQPAYVGLWARQKSWCSDDDRRIRFTLRGTEEVESACDFDRIEGGNGRWSVRQTCHVEGSKTRSRMEISVEGDRMTLAFPDRQGSRTRVVRCP